MRHGAPAAATRLRLLEQDFGVTLLERRPQGVRPTVAGQAMAQHAGALMNLAKRLDGDMQAFAGRGYGTVRFHAAHSALAGHGLAAKLTRFAAARPGVQVEIREGSSLAILHQLAEGDIDLGIVTIAGAVPEGCEAWPWRRDRLMGVLPLDHALAARRGCASRPCSTCR
ncbi:LysR family transcriptional regulator [Roseomonas sp. KE0001]|nr:LysR family transcriptional regulator [Roseomonas sp. KE0001]